MLCFWNNIVTSVQHGQIFYKAQLNVIGQNHINHRLNHFQFMRPYLERTSIVSIQKHSMYNNIIHVHICIEHVQINDKNIFKKITCFQFKKPSFDHLPLWQSALRPATQACRSLYELLFSIYEVFKSQCVITYIDSRWAVTYLKVCL